MKTSLRLGTLTLGLLALSLARSGSAADRDRDGKPPLPAPAVAHGSPVARGKTPPALAAPVIASCGEADGNATATWGAVTDATKYSVEFVVGYDLTGADGCADAFLEFAKATDTEITAAAKHLDRAKLRAWLTDSKTPADRLGVYAMMLGLCGNAADAPFLHGLLTQSPLPDRVTANFGGILAGYTLLDSKSGWTTTKSRSSGQGSATGAPSGGTRRRPPNRAGATLSR